MVTSREKTSIIDWNTVVRRLKKYTRSDTQAQLSEKFGISSNDFSMRKNKGTLLPIIIPWAINQKVSLDWIFCGVGSVNTVSDELLPDENESVDFIESDAEIVTDDLYSNILSFSQNHAIGFDKLKNKIETFIDAWTESQKVDDNKNLG